MACLAGGEEHLDRDREDARLTLDRLGEHGRGALAHRRAQRVGVVAGDGDEAAWKRAE